MSAGAAMATEATKRMRAVASFMLISHKSV
jgi:hypothetical protein